MNVKGINQGIEKVKEIIQRDSKFKILNLNGDFLSGKTTIIKSLISELDFVNEYNVYTYVNDWDKYNYLYDITSDFFSNSNLQHPEFLSDESQFFVKSFFDTVSTLNISNKELFKEINNYLLIENSDDLSDELEKKIKSGISNELKRNLILYYYQISIETIFADLLNNFFPLNEQIDSLSDYLMSREPIKILLVFDDAQSIPPKIEKWFHQFFSYLNNKKLGDLMLYEYKGKDTQISLGEFFKIDLIFIGRNKKFNFEGFDIEVNNIELNYPDYNQLDESDKSNFTKAEYSQSPIFGNPALITAYNQYDEEKKTSTIIFATNHLLKYVPTEFQRAIIFCSIFDKFSSIELNLFEESNFKYLETEKILSKIDFVNNINGCYSFQENAKRILLEVNNLIFESLDRPQLVKLSNDIAKVFPNISYSEFEILRELAYYKEFDKNYLIENYFNNSKRISSFIEKNIFYFNRDKSFYSLQEKHLSPLKEYNSIRDKNTLDEKYKSIQEIFNNYQIEIEKRNTILSDDVVKVGNEISEFCKEKEKMETESDLLSKNEIALRNEVFEIDQQLKPFIHQNSKRKSTLNILALIISVAIIFNSDRISELLFSTTSDFEIVILINLLLLLVLYGNGLMRYFRVKFKSEELYSLKQSKSNLENQINKLSQELEILNADIRAKDAKIEDLKKHVDRMNKQILENKNKLEKRFLN